MIRRLRQLLCPMLFLVIMKVWAADGISSVVAEPEYFGLYPASDFRLATGNCSDCPVLAQSLWYFKGDSIAVPQSGVPSAGYLKGVGAQHDVREWYLHASARARDYPNLIWVGSPNIVSGATLQDSGDTLRLADGSTIGFQLIPKLASNRSYYDRTTGNLFRRRTLRIHGFVERRDGKRTFVARTIWPEDYVINAAHLESASAIASDTIPTLIHESESWGNSGLETKLIWERQPGTPRNWSGAAVLGFMLNGAQGDDDEAHGGHFAIVTGRYGSHGELADWLVNNFYNLDSYSEKGIIASMVPMDNYLMDLNSGQSYYRPSYMLVAILRNDRVPYLYQGAIERVFNHFYRHDLLYQHARSNCAGISLDTMRSLGWHIPLRGATNYMKAIAAYPYMTIKDGKLESGEKAFQYLSEEQTRLYPAVAFDAIGSDLLHLVGAIPGVDRSDSDFEGMLKEDVEAIMFLRIPQIPSSRAVGSPPIFSFDEYMNRVPKDHANWKIIPVDPRPFPEQFIDDDVLASRRDDADSGAKDFKRITIFGGIIFVGFVFARHRKRIRNNS